MSCMQYRSVKEINIRHKCTNVLKLDLGFSHSTLKDIIISFHLLFNGDTHFILEYYPAGWMILEYYAAIWVHLVDLGDNG